MNPWIDYLVKMFLVSGLLYGYFHLALKDKRFHHWNRFYLLSAVLLSVALPLIHISVQGDKEVDYNLLYKVWQLLNSGQVHNTTISATAAQKSAWITLSDLPLLLYVTVIAAQIVVFTWHIGYLRKLFIKSPHIRLEKITLVETNAKGTPYSFFRWIFWNREMDLNSSEGQHILRHELTHVRQKHTLDKIFLKLLCILFFPVIFMHLIRKELQLIHEYLADKEASSDGDITAYATLLISQAFETSRYSFTNSFFQSPIKRRIAMMNCFSNPRYSYLRKLMFLPLAVVLFGLLAFRVESRHPILTIKLQQAELHLQKVFTINLPPAEAAPKLPAQSAIRLDTVPKHPTTVTTRDVQLIDTQASRGSAQLDSVLVVIDGKIYYGAKGILGTINPASIESITVLKDKSAVDKYGQAAAHGVLEIHMKHLGDSTNVSEDADNKVFTKVEFEPEFPGGDTAWTSFVRNVIMKNMDQLVKDKKSGICEVQFIVNRTGYVTGVQALTMQGSVLAKVCVDAISSGPRWVPARQNGIAVTSYRREKIVFEMP